MTCRLEAARVYPLANGRVVTVTIRKTVTPEDPYLVLARAKGLAVRTGEPVDVDRISRVVKDYLIKTNISI